MDKIVADLSIKKDTLQKAIRQGRITLQDPKEGAAAAQGQTKSLRTQADSQTGMGKACSNAVGRVLASTQGIAATIRFNNQTDLSGAGVLLSLPALLSNGLLTHSHDFKLNGGYYSEESIFLCLAFCVC